MLMTTNLSDLWPQRKQRPCMPYGKPKNTYYAYLHVQSIYTNMNLCALSSNTHTQATHTQYTHKITNLHAPNTTYTHMYICTHTPARIKTQRDGRATFIGNVWQPRNLPQHVHDSSQQPDQVALLRRNGGMLQRFVYASVHAICVHMCMGAGPWRSRKRIPHKFELFGRYTRELRRTAL
jgi:hypothetical protein